MAAYPYADYAATRPLRPEVKAALLACWEADASGVPLGNAGARQHASGRRAHRLLQQSREEIAELFQVTPEEVYFTSGATEACNIAILGTFQRCWQQRPHLVSVSTEHPAVLGPLEHCDKANPSTQVHLAPVDKHGAIATSHLPITEQTGLVAAMAVNNETGVMHDLATIHQHCQHHGAPLLIDATQAWGRIPLGSLPAAEFIAVSGHKIGAPTGCGILIVRRHLGISPLFFGGGQQKTIRPGTESVTNAVAMATAGVLAETEAAVHAQPADHPTAGLTDSQRAAETRLREALPDVLINGSGTKRAPGICNISLPGLPRGWLAACKAQISSGSACSSQHGQTSHVLQAMGHTETLAGNSLRISLPVDADEETWLHLIDLVIEAAQHVQRRH